MSFSNLPYELQEAILADQDKSDLTSLCLVSKSSLEIARPLLYRSLEITFYSKDEEKQHYEYLEEEEDTETRQRSNGESFEESFIRKISRQAALLRTFGQHSEWNSYVKEVEAIIAGDPDQLVGELIHLVSSFSALQSLKMSPGAAAEVVWNKAMESMLGSCSRNLRSLYLDGAGSKTDELHQVLRNFPLLESLALPELHEDEDPLLTTSYEDISLANLKNLVVPHPNRPFFHTFTISLPSLVSLSVDFAALPALDPSRLFTIRALTLSGFVDLYNQSSLSIVPRILGGCTSLRSFKLVDGNGQDDSQVRKELATRRFLHHLSPTLQYLSLATQNLDPSYLLDWITSTPSTLKQITLSRLTHTTISYF
ncbi:hypothetical protein JCM5350_003746 [Sporobolomyces pararoseus]